MRALLLSLTLAFFSIKAYSSTLEEVKAKFQEISPRWADIELQETDFENVYSFWSGTRFTYVYYVNNHIIMGDMIDLERKVSLGEEAKKDRILAKLAAVEGQSINYGPQAPKRVLNVFTDIDCPFCRKLHKDIPTLTEAGVQVRYFAFPVAGIGSNSYDKYVSVWCSEDQQAALDLAKSGKTPPSKTCENPIDSTFALGQELGLRGTPMIIIDDGEVLDGYKPAEFIISDLGLDKP